MGARTCARAAACGVGRTTGSLYADSGLAGSSRAPWHIKICSPTGTPVKETSACCTASTLRGGASTSCTSEPGDALLDQGRT
jgi:hypothetical protein